MSDTPNDNLLVKVRKLLAQAEDPSVTEAEAEAFNTKAAELIAKYGIDRALLAAAGTVKDEVTHTVISIDPPYSRDKAQLLNSIAHPLRCQPIMTGRSGVDRVTIFGFGSDLQRVELLYTSLLLQATNQLVHIRPDNGYHYESTAAYRRSWLAGFAAAVYHRLSTAETKAVTDQPVTTNGTSTALVLRDRNTQVEDALKAAFPRVRPARRRHLSGTGYSDGHAAGHRADLGTSRLAHQRTALNH